MNLSRKVKQTFQFSDLPVDNFKFFYRAKCSNKDNCTEVSDPNLKMKAIKVFFDNIDRANYMPTTYPEWLFGPHNFFDYDKVNSQNNTNITDLSEDQIDFKLSVENRSKQRYIDLVEIEPILIHSSDQEILEQMDRLNAVLFTGGGSYPFKRIQYSQFDEALQPTPNLEKQEARGQQSRNEQAQNNNNNDNIVNGNVNQFKNSFINPHKSGNMLENLRNILKEKGDQEFEFQKQIYLKNGGKEEAFDPNFDDSHK